MIKSQKQLCCVLARMYECVCSPYVLRRLNTSVVFNQERRKSQESGCTQVDACTCVHVSVRVHRDRECFCSFSIWDLVQESPLHAWG